MMKTKSIQLKSKSSVLRVTRKSLTASLFERCCRSLRKNCPYSELFWPVFSHIQTEYGYSVFLCIQSECGKIRTRITPNKDTFHAVNATFTVLLRIILGQVVYII